MMILTVGNEKPQKNLKDVRKIAALFPEHRFKIVTQGEDVPLLLGKADLYLSCALWEGLPRAIVEALAHGVPVLAYAVGGISEVVQDGVNGLLVPAGDLGGIFSELILLSKSPEILKKMSEAAKKSIGKEFDINCMVRQQEELYLSLVHPK